MRQTAILVAAIGASAVCAAPAMAKSRTLSPYIEVGQVLTADVQSGDVLTYSTVAAGIDASVQTRRAQVQISYRYEHRFAEKGNLTDGDIHSGLIRANVAVAKGLNIEGGALATRARSDVRGDAPGVLVGNVSNISQVYSAYAGPTFGTHVGPIGFSGGYRYGYTKVEAPGSTGVDPSQPRLDVYDASHNQMAQASLNLKSGVWLPVGITVSGAWERDDATQLSQRYDGKFARGDVILPVSRSLALTAGAGYEKIQVSQRNAVLDSSGNAVVDSRGRFVEDTSAPRHIAYNFDGIYYDAGVVWRPSPRTQVEAHVGKRYGSISYTGTVAFQPTKSVAVAVNVYDGVTTFGRQLRDGIGTLPTSFNEVSGVGQDYNGCVFGSNGAGAGGCLNGVFQSISTSAFRARGVNAVASLSRGPWRFGAGAGYANRKFLSGNDSSAFTVNGVTDESYYVQAFAGYKFDPRTALNVTAFGNYYDSGISGAPGVYGFGGTASLGRSFGHLSANAAVGIYNTSRQGTPSVTSFDAALGARYSF